MSPSSEQPEATGRLQHIFMCCHFSHHPCSEVSGVMSNPISLMLIIIRSTQALSHKAGLTFPDSPLVGPLFFTQQWLHPAKFLQSYSEN